MTISLARGRRVLLASCYEGIDILLMANPLGNVVVTLNNDQLGSSYRYQLLRLEEKKVMNR